jgi:predicted nucleic acid-binding Zn ribbon protein
VLHPVAIHFKGSGFHNTDYKTKRGGADGAKESGDSKGSDSKSGESKPSESKPAAASASSD